jgi:uracil-DNA glycosylase family 4
MGFFGDVPAKTGLEIRSTPDCKACGLFKKCKSPKLQYVGQGGRRILIVSESPGKEEDREGRLMVGNSSIELIRQLKLVGIHFQKDCWLTNAAICHSPNITPEHIKHCRPNLANLINELKPTTIITLGENGLRAVLPLAWRDDVGLFSRWPGWVIPSQRLNAWICPTFHPAYLFKAKKTPVELFFRRHLEGALKVSPNAPWRDLPRWEEEVEIIVDPSIAARKIAKLSALGGLTAFDYECTTLKPDGDFSRILSAAICWEGKRTIAFPWAGPVVPAMTEYLKNPHPKIAANAKFEDRWTRTQLGFPVNGWKWDTMINGHVLDNRKGTKSLKFQSFVMLGMPDYDSHISDYMGTGESYVPNKLTRLDLRPLLLYNGLDALLEYKVAELQMRMLKCYRFSGKENH